jgi:hypothetical protein
MEIAADSEPGALFEYDAGAFHAAIGSAESETESGSRAERLASLAPRGTAEVSGAQRWSVN